MADELSTSQIGSIRSMARDAGDALAIGRESFSREEADHRLVFDGTGCRLIHVPTDTIVVESTFEMAGSFLTTLRQEGGLQTLLGNEEFMNEAFGDDPDPRQVSVFDSEPPGGVPVFTEDELAQISQLAKRAGDIELGTFTVSSDAKTFSITCNGTSCRLVLHGPDEDEVLFSLLAEHASFLVENLAKPGGYEFLHAVMSWGIGKYLETLRRASSPPAVADVDVLMSDTGAGGGEGDEYIGVSVFDEEPDDDDDEGDNSPWRKEKRSYGDILHGDADDER